jgi:hypothetical protein
LYSTCTTTHSLPHSTPHSIISSPLTSRTHVAQDDTTLSNHFNVKASSTRRVCFRSKFKIKIKRNPRDTVQCFTVSCQSFPQSFLIKHSPHSEFGNQKIPLRCRMCTCTRIKRFCFDVTLKDSTSLPHQKNSDPTFMFHVHLHPRKPITTAPAPPEAFVVFPWLPSAWAWKVF